MNTANTPNVPPPQIPSPSGRGQPYQFTPDELRVLRECNRDSFFQRCLPIGTLLGVTTYYSVQAGHLKPSLRWGSTPKVIVASIIGYFIGKISYQSKCAERIMQLPDSRLGAILRQRKRGAGFQESLEHGYGTGMSLSPFSTISPTDTYSDIDSLNTGDIDTTRPDNSGLDDYHRPTIDNNPVFEEESMPVQQEKTTSYDELRKQNREDYLKHRSPVYRSIPSPAEAPPVTQGSPVSSNQVTSGSKRTNIYGDIME